MLNVILFDLHYRPDRHKNQNDWDKSGQDDPFCAGYFVNSEILPEDETWLLWRFHFYFCTGQKNVLRLRCLQNSSSSFHRSEHHISPGHLFSLFLGNFLIFCGILMNLFLKYQQFFFYLFEFFIIGFQILFFQIVALTSKGLPLIDQIFYFHKDFIVSEALVSKVDRSYPRGRFLISFHFKDLFFIYNHFCQLQTKFCPNLQRC